MCLSLIGCLFFSFLLTLLSLVAQDIDIQNRILIEELESAREGFEAVLAEARRFSEGKLNTMTQSLDRHINNLEGHIVNALSDLYGWAKRRRGCVCLLTNWYLMRSGVFVDPTCAPKSVLEKLHTVESTLKTVEEKVRVM